MTRVDHQGFLPARTRAVHVAASLAAALSLCGYAAAQDVTNPGDPIVASSVNFPAGEPPSAAIDNTVSTKYLNFDRVNTGFTVTPSGTGVVRALAIITANDAPPRDPFTYRLEGSNDGGANFAIISEGALNPATARRAISQVTFANETIYTQYRVIFPTIRNFGGANSMQVAEVQLLTQGDILTPGDAVSTVYTDGAFSNPNEGAASLLDERLDTKMGIFNGNLGPTFITVTPGLGASTVTGFSIFSANDDTGNPGRTPQYVTLSGTTNGTDFTQIFTTPLAAATANYQDQQFFFPNSTGYRHYRIELGPSQNNTFLQVSEFELFGVVVALPPDNDECATAMPVSVGATSSNNFNATGTDISPCGDNDSLDVWFSFLATSTDLLEIDTFGPGVLDTTLTVYRTCDSDPVACNDNARGGKSRVRFEATLGRTYRIRVAGAGATSGAFTLNVNDTPEVHSDILVPLAYNFNGMVHTGEAGLPDAPNGFRSISDRGLRLTGGVGSFEVGLEGSTGIPYSINTNAGQLDIVHLADRNTTDNGNWHFDSVPGRNDNAAGTLNLRGVQPAWLGCTDQTTPQFTDTCRLGAVFGPATQVAVLYQMSNGGGFFDVTLSFDDGSTATVTVQGPDWFGDQQPGDALPGAAYQEQLGVFFGTQDTDLANAGTDLNVTEAIISTESLLNGLGFDANGKRLTGISFSNRSNLNGGYAILAATIRDPGSLVAAPCSPIGIGTATGSPAFNDGTATTHLSVAVQPGINPDGSGVGVTVDLAQIGGANGVQMFDDGQHNDGSAGDNVFGLDYLVPAGTSPGVYQLSFNISDAQGRTGSGFVCVEIVIPPPPPPANDSCANATAISGPGTFAFDTTNATADGPAYCEGNVSGSVWFAYTGTMGSTATIETCGNAGFDTVLAATTACGAASIACNDDTCDLQSRIELPASTGQAVLIRVSGFATGNVGAGSIVITEVNGCPADFNLDGFVNPDDLSDFITCFFLDVIFPGTCAAADFNGDGFRDPDDLSDFITTFFLAVQFGC